MTQPDREVFGVICQLCATVRMEIVKPTKRVLHCPTCGMLRNHYYLYYDHRTRKFMEKEIPA